MKKLLILLLFVANISHAQGLKKYFKFATFYGAASGGTSISDVETFSVTDGLQVSTVKTPFDYNIAFGVRKIARFGYENRANTFYDGTEDSWSDGANVGKVKGLEFLFEIDYTRQQGIEYIDQHHFIRYVQDLYIVKGEYLEDGFADIKFVEFSQRYRYKVNNKLSFNAGFVQRLSEPYGYDPLADWRLDNGDIHYTYLALQEGYNVDVWHQLYYDPQGNVVANSAEAWDLVVIPQVLADYTDKKRSALDLIVQHSLVLGFDYYHYTNSFWTHTWANIMPYHYDDGDEYSYHKYEGNQWLDYSGGLIVGAKINKRLGVFTEAKYNKYWNRKWYDFKLGVNYIIR